MRKLLFAFACIALFAITQQNTVAETAPIEYTVSGNVHLALLPVLPSEITLNSFTPSFTDPKICCYDNCGSTGICCFRC